MKHMESSERTQTKSQDDRPSPELPHESRANLRVPARVCEVEGGAVCLTLACEQSLLFGRVKRV